jgi:hypothetical protein
MLLPPIKDSFSLAGTSILTDPKVDSLCPTRLRLRQRSMALHKERPVIGLKSVRFLVKIAKKSGFVLIY